MRGAGAAPFRLLALDIDGTLLRNDKTISERTHRALERARGEGTRLVLVTGRRYPSALRVADQLGGKIPLILHNGALIIEEGEVTHRELLPARVARKAIRVGRRAGADPVLHMGHQGEGRLVVEGAGRPSGTLLAYYLDKSHPDVRVVPDLEDALSEDPLQVMFGGTIAEMDALLVPLEQELKGEVRIERTVYNTLGVSLLDLLHPSCGKARALRLLEERWEIPSEETLAIGDNWNDREMLEGAGLGLVMGNADPALLRLGFPVLPTNDEDGVAVALERYFFEGKRKEG
ncbi:MAG TPA: HAD family hydrolase [Vicinamibacteria bacterium]|nr:HAD family hydrolase [Vicinamibacteria bacterium]